MNVFSAVMRQNPGNREFSDMRIVARLSRRRYLTCFGDQSARRMFAVSGISSGVLEALR